MSSSDALRALFDLACLITAVACKPNSSYDVQCENLNDDVPP